MSRRWSCAASRENKSAECMGETAFVGKALTGDRNVVIPGHWRGHAVPTRLAAPSGLVAEPVMVAAPRFLCEALVALVADKVVLPPAGTTAAPVYVKPAPRVHSLPQAVRFHTGVPVGVRTADAQAPALRIMRSAHAGTAVAFSEANTTHAPPPAALVALTGSRGRVARTAVAPACVQFAPCRLLVPAEAQRPTAADSAAAPAAEFEVAHSFGSKMPFQPAPPGRECTFASTIADIVDVSDTETVVEHIQGPGPPRSVRTDGTVALQP